MTCDGIVADANIIQGFIQEEMTQKGEIVKVIKKILPFCGLAITDLIENQWRNTTGNQFFNIWFDENLKNNRIKYITEDIKLSKTERQIIHNKYGLPKNGRDIEYIKCSLNTTHKYILTYDIHFFDPKQKMASVKTKNKIKNARSGALCKYLWKKYTIIVGLPLHCCSDLKIS